MRVLVAVFVSLLVAFFAPLSAESVSEQPCPLGAWLGAGGQIGVTVDGKSIKVSVLGTVTGNEPYLPVKKGKGFKIPLKFLEKEFSSLWKNYVDKVRSELAIDPKSTEDVVGVVAIDRKAEVYTVVLCHASDDKKSLYMEQSSSEQTVEALRRKPGN